MKLRARGRDIRRGGEFGGRITESGVAVPAKGVRSRLHRPQRRSVQPVAVERFTQVEVLYWLHESRRDLVLQSPASDTNLHGTFSLRSPVRPNPIGTSVAKLIGVEGSTVLVRGLDCLDGTPLIDLKPDRCQFTPVAPPQPGDYETEGSGQRFA